MVGNYRRFFALKPVVVNYRCSVFSHFHFHVFLKNDGCQTTTLQIDSDLQLDVDHNIVRLKVQTV